MTLRTFRFIGTLLAALVVATNAAAQTAEGFAINRFQPAERGSDWFATDSLDLRGKGRLALGVVGDWAHRPLVIYDDAGNYYRAPISNQLWLHVGGAVNLADRLRFAFSLPVLAVNRGVPGVVDGVTYGTKKGASVGDLRLSADVRLLGEYGDPFTTAIGLQVHVPTGAPDSYASDGKVRLVPHWLFAGDLGPFTYGGGLGFDGRFRSADFAGEAFGPEVTFAASAGLRVANKKVVIGPEVYGSTVVSDGGDGFFKKRTTPVDLLFGTHARLGDFQLGAGAGPGLSRGIGSPDVRVVASLTWFPEPPKPVVVLPPTDRDGDGIADGVDACPDTPGPASADPAKNGCPLPKDRDKDGIIDDEDACPDEPGVKSDDPKKNGCPLPKDTDGDTITDDVDACVNDPGPANEDPKKHGCPKVVVVEGEVKILERIEFDTDKATIRPVSDTILQAVADTLKSHSEIKRIQVQGHTDNKGSKAHNKNLSERRAAAVVKWLTKSGVDARRLESKGFGQEQPIDDNGTESGRQNNRRVQFIILEKDGEGPSTVETKTTK